MKKEYALEIKKKELISYDFKKTEKKNKKNEPPFIFNFLTKHLTNILNDVSKLNFADDYFFKLCTHLILLNKKTINHVDVMNIISAYSRHGYMNYDMSNIIKKNAELLLKDDSLKYMEFINLFNSISTFCLMEEKEKEKQRKKEENILSKNDKTQRVEKQRKKHLQNDSVSLTFTYLMNMMIRRLKEKPKNKKVLLYPLKGNNNELKAKKEETFIDEKEREGNKYICNERNNKDYNYTTIKDKDILDNLSINHICNVLSSLAKLNIHDIVIYEKCLRNIKKKIYRIDGKCLSMYLLYVSKFKILIDKQIYKTICDCFNFKIKSMKTDPNKQNIIHNCEVNYKIKKEDKYYDKMKELCERLNNTDIVNSIYIVRCLIKMGMAQPSYENSMLLIWQYLKNIYKIFKKEKMKIQEKQENQEKCDSMPNIIKVEKEKYHENCILKKKKINIQSCCILINSISYLITHIYIKNKTYIQLSIQLLIYSYQYIFKKMKLKHTYYTMNTADMTHLEKTDAKEEIRKFIKNKIDSASLRQIQCSIYMLFHMDWECAVADNINELHSLNIYKKKCIYKNYPLYLLKQFYFFLTFSFPFGSFEKYSSLHLLNKIKKIHPLYFTKDNTKQREQKQMPDISNNEIIIYQTLLDILRKKKKEKSCNVLSNKNVFVYSVDIIIYYNT